jgi:hypothetical protein
MSRLRVLNKERKKKRKEKKRKEKKKCVLKKQPETKSQIRIPLFVPDKPP